MVGETLRGGVGNNSIGDVEGMREGRRKALVVLVLVLVQHLRLVFPSHLVVEKPLHYAQPCLLVALCAWGARECAR